MRARSRSVRHSDSSTLSFPPSCASLDLEKAREQDGMKLTFELPPNMSQFLVHSLLFELSVGSEESRGEGKDEMVSESRAGSFELQSRLESDSKEESTNLTLQALRSEMYCRL